jgi:glycine hydroxymethyltransferase
VPGDLNGLRIGTPELVRRGVTPADAPALADLIAEGLRSNRPADVATRTAALRARFTGLHYIRA